VKLDADSALLWVHGVSTALNPKLNYYQGKRRIPAPLVIKRHAGKSDLVKIGEEILGLSKMNWNSFDLYAKLPATIESSRQIAKIGSLMQRFGSTSYDYRLFM
jgi:argonaute-like protein implicated in RNA metabolism and viral defense